MYTPESYGKRVQAWRDEAGENTASWSFPRRTDEEMTKRRIGDAERAACTILADVRASHLELRRWLRLVSGSPTYHQPFDGAVNGKLAYPPDITPDEYTRDLDQAAWNLGEAIVDHRVRGEEGDDHPISLRLTSSIGTALAEYHMWVLNITRQGRETSLPIDKHKTLEGWNFPPTLVLLWQNGQVTIQQVNPQHQETNVAITNRMTGETLVVAAVRHPM